MNKAMVLAVLALAAGTASARVPAYSSTMTNNSWTASGGDWSGDYMDESRWTKQHVPCPQEWCWVAPTASGTLTMPDGEYETFSSPMFTVPSDVTLTVCGTNSVFRQGATSLECYPEPVWGVGYNGTRFLSVTIGDDFGTGSRVTEMSDYSFRVQADGSRPTVHFDRGTYDFDAGSSHALTTLLFDSAGQEGTTVWFHPGSVLKTYNLMVQGLVDGGTLRFDGATADFTNTAQIPSASRNFNKDVASTTILECVNGSTVTAASLWFGASGAAYGRTTEKSYRMLIDGGSTVTVDGSFGFRRGGDFRLDVSDGAELHLGQNSNAYLPDAETDDPVGGRLLTDIVVSNATVRADGSFGLGRRQAFDAAATATMEVKAGSLLANGGSFAVYPASRLTVADSAWAVGNAAQILSSSAADIPAAVVVATNAQVTVAAGKSLSFGSETAGAAEPDVSLAAGTTLTVDGTLHVYGGRTAFADSTLTGAGTVVVGRSSAASAPELAFSNATVDVSNKFEIYCGDVIAEDTSWTVPASASFGVYGDASLTLRGGSYDCTKGQVQLGAAANGEFVLTLEKGAIYDHGGTYSLYTAAGENSHAKIHLIDGTLRSANIRLNNNSTGRTTVKLDGGVLELKNGFIPMNAGQGTRLEADGGTIRILQYTKDTAAVTGFSETALGPKGLTLDSYGHALIIDQAFDNAQGKSGVLILAGDGEKTFNGRGSTVDTVVVAGGTVVFADDFAFDGTVIVTNGATVALGGSKESLAGLVLGDGKTAGVLRMSSTDTIAVNGPVTVNKARLAFTDTPALDQSLTLVTSTETPSAATQKAWALAQADVALPSGYGAAFGSAATVPGHAFTLTCRPLVTTPVDLASGSSVITEPVGGTVVDTVSSTVGEGADLTLSGPVLCGLLEKHGPGHLTLGCADNYLAKGFVLDGGLLTFATFGAWGEGIDGAKGTLIDGTLEFGSAAGGVSALPLAVETDATDLNAVVVKTDADLTLPDPTMTRGAFIKRGAGTLTFEIDASATWSLSANHIPAGSMDVTGTKWTSPVFPAFDGSGSVPDGTYGALGVAEGELVLRASGETVPTITEAANNVLTLGTPTGTVPPALVLDHVDLFQNGMESFLGCGFTADSFADEARLVISNGASFRPNKLAVAAGSTKPGFKVNVLVDGGDLAARNTMMFNNMSSLSLTNNFLVRNGGFLGAGWLDSSGLDGNREIRSYGPARVTLESGSLMAVKRDGTPLDYLTAYPDNSRFIFNVKDSKIALAGIRTGWSTIAAENPFTFDNGEWDFGDADLVNISFAAVNVGLYATGGGLILAPQAGKVWRLATPIRGDGGFVKRGAGTLRLDTAELLGEKTEETSVIRCTGVNRVEEGVLDLVAGAAKGIVLAGSGTVTGTAESVLLKPAFGDEPETLLFDGATFVGRVKVDLSALESAVVGTSVAVARYAGAAPAASTFKAIGLPKGLGADFTVVAGVVTATVRNANGLLIFVR